MQLHLQYILLCQIGKNPSAGGHVEFLLRGFGDGQIYNSPLNIELLLMMVAAAFSIEFIYRKYIKRSLHKRNKS